LLSDDSGYDLLIYEASPLVSIKRIDNFTTMAMESMNIPDYLMPTKIRVEIKNAQLKNLSVNISEKNLSKIKQQIITDRITLINSNLRAQNALWVAGETSISQMSYEEKKRLFGGIVPDLQGFEYYIGGIFELDNDNTISVPEKTTKSLSVSSFDWRNRHGANNPSSPYYNNGGHGWITSVKDQGNIGACWMFAGCGVTESLLNLYFNQHINIDLSEQDAVSCCPSCWGSPFAALNYIKTSGVVQESCFPYTASRNTPCSNKQCGTNLTKIAGIIGYDRNSEDELKRMIINNGPLSGTICPAVCHAMTLIGFGVVKQGDCIGLDTWDCTTIPIGHSSIGNTYWIFKNQWGTNWGENGFVKIRIAHDQITVYAAETPIINSNYSIKCEDRDGDGYYFWGIGPKPPHCPACSFDVPDGDDSNPNLGPMDEYGNFLPMTVLPLENTNPTLLISTSQTWNTNSSMSANITIPSGVTLTITANVSLSCNIITIQNGGKLILSGGTIDNAYIVAKNNSEFTVQNNGKVLLGGSNQLDIQLGAIFNLTYGEVSLK
jgi:C1A family cysteine protease